MISVIVPVYKVEPYLRRCVDSILAQTFTDFELILVDDGSPDNCPAICDEFAKKDNRVKVIHKANGGLSSARNAGLDVATGEYVLFVDSDDWIAPETLEKTLAVAHEKDSDMIVFDYTEVYEDGSVPPRSENSFAETEQWSHDDFWQHYYGGFSVLCAVAWNKLCKRSLFDKLRYEVGRIHEDELIIYDLVKKANGIVFLNEAFYFYYRRADSIMGTESKKGQTDALCAFLRRAARFAEDGQPQYAARIIAGQIEAFKKCDATWTNDEKRFLFKTMKGIHQTKFSAISPYMTTKRKITVSVLYFSPHLFLFGASMVRKVRK